MKNSIHKITLCLDFPRCTTIILLIGLCIRIALLIILIDIPLFSDAKSYHEVAISIGSSRVFSTFWPPALPMYLSLCHRLFGASELVSQASMIAWYILLFLIQYTLFKKLFNYRITNISLLIIAIFPSFIYHSITPLSQLPAAACLLAIILLSIELLDKQRFTSSLVLGCAFAFFALLRPSSILLMLMLSAYLFIKTRKTTSFIPMIIALVLISSWLYKAHSMTGRFVPINDANAANLFYGNNPYTPTYKTWWFGSHGDEEDGVPPGYMELRNEIENKAIKERQDTFRKLALDHIARRPDLFLMRTASRFRCFFAFPTFTGSILREHNILSTKGSLMIIFLDGLIHSIISITFVLFLFVRNNSMPYRTYGPIILLSFLGYAVPYWFSFSHPTYNFPVIPVYMIFSSAYLFDHLHARDRVMLLPTSNRSRVVLMMTVSLYIFIQIEWLLHNLSRI